MLDLYVCLRPVRWFRACPRPVKKPGDVDMVIFRENTEDIYAGIEWEAESAGGEEGDRVPPEGDEGQEDPLPRARAASASSRSRREGTERLVRAAIEYALKHKRKSVTFVHKGNIMKFTEGAFRTGATRSPRASSATRSSPSARRWILGNKEKNAGPHRRGRTPSRSSRATT